MNVCRQLSNFNNMIPSQNIFIFLLQILMSPSQKAQKLDSNPALQLQQTSSYENNKDQLIDDTNSNSVPPIQPSKSSDFFGFWCIVIFFGSIFCIICGFVIYQQNGKQNHHASDKDEDQYIPDEPYKEGDEVVEHFDLIRLNTTTALCLDGSPGSYYMSKTGDPSRILIHFQGGGWCYGNDYQSHLQNCYQRSKTWAGTSAKFLLDTINEEDNIFSKHPDNEFRNWKKVILNYCDGSGHQGTRKDPVEVNGQKLYFRGHNITTQQLDDLQKRIGIFSKAKRVIVSGGSAGGVAVFTWSNYLTQRVKNGKIYFIIDSGIFYDAEDLLTKRHSYKQLLASIMNVTNVEIDPPTPQCLKEHPDQKANCMFAQYLYSHIKAPMFIAQSVYDAWSLYSIYGIRSASLDKCSEEQKKVAELNRQRVTGILHQIGSKKGNGVFGVGCTFHGMVYDKNYVSPHITVPTNSSWTLSRAIAHWFRNKNMNNSRIDLNPWPSNQGCRNITIY